MKGKFGLATEAEYWLIYCIVILCLEDQSTCYLKFLLYHDTNKSFPIANSFKVCQAAVSSMPLKISCSRKQCGPWLSVTCHGHFCRHNTRIESIWLVSVHHELRHSDILYTLYNSFCLRLFWLSPSQTLNNVEEYLSFHIYIHRKLPLSSSITMWLLTIWHYNMMFKVSFFIHNVYVTLGSIFRSCEKSWSFAKINQYD